ncbi:MAG TPA: hypothetical protein VNG33_18545, partial [Polyangiaceae bacterium]|nr:hypothetical protein [Polyangiaceae bacterium]
CSKKAGDSCNANEVRCEGNGRALECIQGKFADVACLGPAGCIDKFRCDRSKAAAGDTCDGDWAACSADGKQFLECKASKLSVTATCSGKLGCFQMGKDLRCDQSQASVGDICSGERASCSADRKEMLTCHGTQFALDVPCRGPQGCADDAGNRIKCDQSLGLAGDKCDGSGGACELGGKRLLECKSGKLEATNFCRGKQGCEASTGKVHCDESLGLVGDSCDAAGAACAVDGMALLKCVKGKLAVAKKCKCSIDGSQVRCGR